MKIDRTNLFRLYMERVAHIAETCDWKTFLTSDEVVNILSDVIEENSGLIDRSDECPHCGEKLRWDDQRYCWAQCNCTRDE